MDKPMEQTPTAHHTSRAKLYVICFLTLFVLTILELMGSSLTAFKAPLLISFAVVKAAIVAGYYMHLKFDHKWFRYMVGIGIVCGVFMFFMFSILFGIDLNIPATPASALHK
jgi:caa(3)-type oxidase subunit IV